MSDDVRRSEYTCRRYGERVAIVTGAARGLGTAVAFRLGMEGAALVLGDLDGERLAWVAAKLGKETGADIRCSAGDLVQRSAADNLAATAIEAFGRIDTLINNAAVLIRKPLTDFDESLLQFAVAANVWPAVHCCRAVLPYMKERGYGRIVNVGGEAWRTGAPYHTVLAGIGKGSLVGLTATLAGEVGRCGITVNCVSPGAFVADDKEADALFPPRAHSDWNPPEVLDDRSRMEKHRRIAIPRVGDVQEVAAAISFLGAPEASYVTGQHLGVSGGLAMI